MPLAPATLRRSAPRAASLAVLSLALSGTSLRSPNGREERQEKAAQPRPVRAVALRRRGQDAGAEPEDQPSEPEPQGAG